MTKLLMLNLGNNLVITIDRTLANSGPSIEELAQLLMIETKWLINFLDQIMTFRRHQWLLQMYVNDIGF